MTSIHRAVEEIVKLSREIEELGYRIVGIEVISGNRLIAIARKIKDVAENDIGYD